ncbi:hypothetical protein [Mesorhizobium sp. M1378]|uniref:hypothetical protein n=1 Tax=Mesorhizobium sp. M1378 TaxID=2957092 RepID=UPI0033399CBF
METHERHPPSFQVLEGPSRSLDFLKGANQEWLHAAELAVARKFEKAKAGQK